MNLLKKFVNSIFALIGFKLIRKSDKTLPFELNSYDTQNLFKAKQISMTTEERLANVILSVKYLNKNRIEGDFVECGVWAGGSIGLAALTDNSKDRKYWLYDTFEGMTEPSDRDPEFAMSEYIKTLNRDGSSSWCFASESDVKSNLQNVGVELTKCEFIKGDVTQTLLENVPKKISLLRLDTDWYESTLLELKILYPLLSSGGILIIDDYGAWSGARQAVDEYFSEFDFQPFMFSIDHTARLIVKP